MSIDSVTARSADLLEAVRFHTPRVHCITNTVAMPITANVLLAAGAVPSMTVTPDEIEFFVGGADALLINLGTLDPDRRRAIELAIPSVRTKNRPWVLDPVLVHRSPPRLGFARRLLALRPTLVRGNRDELQGLSDAAGDPALAIAQQSGAIVAMTGAEDQVCDSQRTHHVRNGSTWMDTVTGIGCALSALSAAFLAVADDPFNGAVAAVLTAAVAGELAADHAHGPGSFAVAFLDALHHLGPEQIEARARVR